MNSHPLVLDAEAVDQLLPQIDVLQEMRQLFIELGRKQAVQPAQTLTLLPEDKGDFITYLGAASGAGTFGAKLSPYLIQENGPIITAWTILMSMQSGQPLMLCDSGRLTRVFRLCSDRNDPRQSLADHHKAFVETQDGRIDLSEFRFAQDNLA